LPEGTGWAECSTSTTGKLRSQSRPQLC
jgi:hypothetical protein